MGSYYLKLGPLRIRRGKNPMVSKGSHGALIRAGGISIWAETNSNGLWNIASYHRRDSITWRWILSLSIGRRSRGDDGKWRPRWFGWHRYGVKGGSGQATVLFGSVGLAFHWQQHMFRATPHKEGE